MLTRHITRQAQLMRNAVNSTRNYQIAAGRKQTMNDLPVPKGDWQETHSRKNARYNAVLFLGIAALASTIGVVKSTGVVYFNFSPPKSID